MPVYLSVFLSTYLSRARKKGRERGRARIVCMCVCMCECMCVCAHAHERAHTLDRQLHYSRMHSLFNSHLSDASACAPLSLIPRFLCPLLYVPLSLCVPPCIYVSSAQVNQLQHDLSRIMAHVALEDGADGGETGRGGGGGGGGRGRAHELERTESWPRQRVAGNSWTGSWDASIGEDNGKQRRVGWVGGDGERERKTEREREIGGRGGGVAGGSGGGVVARDEYGLPAPAMDSDDDEDDDVVLGVLQRRQEHLAATTGVCVCACVWACGCVGVCVCVSRPSLCL